MVCHVCPWWGGFFIDNPIRKLIHSPKGILGPHLRPGMTVLDFGCGMGLFSLAMARMVGPEGRVIAADVQPQMLDVVGRRARRGGLGDRLRLVQCKPDRIGLDTPLDFALAFWVLHEVPDLEGPLQEIAGHLRSSGKFLVVEPRIHVSRARFHGILAVAEKMGLRVIQQPRVWLSRAALLGRVAEGAGRCA